MFDLSQFPELALKQLIGIGEIAHGSSGLHEIEFQLIQAAILNLETREIGIEAPSNIVARLNQLLSYSNNSPLTRESLSELYPIWRSDKLLAGLQWIYDYNHDKDNRDDQVSLFGYDVRLPLTEIQQLAEWTNARPELKSSLGQFEKITLAELRALEMLSHEHKRDVALREFNEILFSVDVILKQKNLPKSIAEIAVRIQSWATVFRLWAISGMERAYAERDRLMAEQILKRSRNKEQKGPVLILAHLNHLLFNNLSVRNSKPHVVAGPVMGNYLHKELSNRYSLIGLFPNEIEISNPGTGKVESFKSSSKSFESSLGAIGEGARIFRVKNLPDQFNGWITVGDVEPSNSPLLQTYSSYDLRLMDQLDFVLAVDQVRSEKLF